MLKHLTLVLVLTLTSLAVSAQNTQYRFCLLSVSNRTYEVFLDYGHYGKPAVNNSQLEKDAEIVHKSQSIVIALNYMSSKGWECLNASTLPARPNSQDANAATAYTSYLLRRRIQ